MTVTINGTTGIDKVQDGVVTSASIADGAVTPTDLSTGKPSWDSSGNLQFNSGYGSVATAYGCRAWVNFNGAGTIAIRASGNVSSITDGGTGQYTINFTNAMPDANYTPVASGGNLSSDLNYNVFRMPGYSGAGGVAPTSSACKMTVVQTGVGLLDIEYVYFSVFR